MPVELQERLKAFVPEPPAPKLKVTDEIPEIFNWREESFDFEARRREVKVKQISVAQSAMERHAPHDPHTVLRLIEPPHSGRDSCSIVTMDGPGDYHPFESIDRLMHRMLQIKLRNLLPSSPL